MLLVYYNNITIYNITIISSSIVVIESDLHWSIDLLLLLLQGVDMWTYWFIYFERAFQDILQLSWLSCPGLWSSVFTNTRSHVTVWWLLDMSARWIRGTGSCGYWRQNFTDGQQQQGEAEKPQRHRIGKSCFNTLNRENCNSCTFFIPLKY